MANSLQPIEATIDVVTPENISFQYQLAGPFRRLPAFLLDLALRAAVWVGCLFVFLLSGIFTRGGELAMAFWLLTWFVMEWFYGGLMETFWNGQTFGKRMFGIRVVRTDGQPINGLQAVMRNILRAVDMMPLIPVSAWIDYELPLAVPTCLFGLLTPIVTRRCQRLGDLVCGTMVVVEERSWVLSIPKIEDEAVKRLSAEIPASFLAGPRLSQALAAYAERRRYMAPPRRADVAKHLAEPLRQRFGFPPDVSADLLLCALFHRTFVVENEEEMSTAAQGGTT